jgi:hypothetical protein
MSAEKTPPKGGHDAGYGKPPLRTRFRKGQSGNPSGRPRGITGERAKALALQEAYRLVKVREGESVVTLPAIQAILRGQLALAAKGNGPAQRAVIAAVQAIEQDVAAQAAARESSETIPAMSDLELARRIAFILGKGQREREAQQQEAAAMARAAGPLR